MSPILSSLTRNTKRCGDRKLRSRDFMDPQSLAWVPLITTSATTRPSLLEIIFVTSLVRSGNASIRPVHRSFPMVPTLPSPLMTRCLRYSSNGTERYPATSSHKSAIFSTSCAR
jgi:hypothetical protein